MLRSEKAVVKAARRVSEINRRLATASYDGTLGGFLLAEALVNELTKERDAKLADIAEYDARVWVPPRKGGWFATWAGRRFWREDPRPGDIDIRDIAHCLSLICRYCGHTDTMYSVAQHSVLVSEALPDQYALPGLLHDAAEAYLGDIVRPVKEKLTGFDDMETAVMNAVCLRYGLDRDNVNMWAAVKRADNALAATEFRDVACHDAKLTPHREKPLAETITPWPSATAERLFLKRFRKVGGK